MSCDVRQYLPSDDKEVAHIEQLVHDTPMSAFQGKMRGRKQRRFLPSHPIELVITTASQRSLTMAGYYSEEFEEHYLSLYNGKECLREFHGHLNHFNPKRFNSPVSWLHMHFPSEKYPLEEESSYAYPLGDDPLSDIQDCVSFFCNEIGINLESWQPELG